MDWIFDLGMHTGQDTAFYLAKGFNVVAVEANPALVAAATRRFRPFIESERLIILNRGIGPQTTSAPFVINEFDDGWSSFDASLGQRGGSFHVIEVQILSLHELFTDFGVPHYVKCDLEGSDIHVIEQIARCDKKPAFLSVENGQPHMIHSLSDAGYRRFSLVNQLLVPDQMLPSPSAEGRYLPYRFEAGASGAFGYDLPQPWLTADEVLRLSIEYWEIPNRDPIVDGWYDLHCGLDEV